MGNEAIRLADREPFGFMRVAQVTAVVPVSRQTIWRWVREGRFPKPVKLTERVSAWRVGDVRQWSEQFGKEAA